MLQNLNLFHKISLLITGIVIIGHLIVLLTEKEKLLGSLLGIISMLLISATIIASAKEKSKLDSETKHTKKQ